MITEIYIENNRLDLSSDLSNEFTFAIDDIKDFASRNTSFSKTIILPGNAVNNKLFGHIFEFGSRNFYDDGTTNVGYNFNAAKSASCIIYINKIQFFKGILRLLQINIDRGAIEYECVVFGELGGFISAIGNAKLEDLDFSAYDHYWTHENITASWEQASGTTASGMGYYYPLIDYGQVSANAKLDWDVKAFRPALFVREYIDKIITNSGYTWESDFFNSNLFKRLVIPNNKRTFSMRKAYTFQRRNYSYDFQDTDGTVKNFPLPVSEITQNFTVNGTFDVFTYTGSQFDGRYFANIRLAWRKNSSIPFRFEVVVNNAVIAQHSWESYSSEVLITQDVSFEGPISLNTNDQVKFRFVQEVASDFQLIVQVGQGLIQIQSSTPTDVDLVYGELIKINETSIPKGIFQKDFFASIVKMFNLYVVEDSNKSKHLKIIPYIDYYTTSANFLQVNDLEEELLIDDNSLLLLDDYFANYLDWSYKVDRNKPIKLKPMSEINGRYMEFKYKSDVDYYNEDYAKHYSQGYGDYIEDTGYEFVNDKQTNEIIFSATPLLGYAGRDKIIPTVFKLSNTQNSQSEDRTDHNIRIMQVRKITGVAPWHIKNNNGNLVQLTSYGYAGHLDDPDAPQADINFGVPQQLYFSLPISYPSANLFNGFWSDYIAEITDKDSKLLTCNVYLKASDIYSLDFAKLIYIDGSLWRLNKVIDFNPTQPDSTKCEFLKVIELTYA